MLLIADEPWFVAKDLVEAIGGRWHHTSLATVPDRHKGSERITTPGGLQEITVVSEAGMNRYLSRSDLPDAQPWQDHICEVILPTIRKTGGYIAKPLTPAEQLLATAQSLVALERSQLELERRQAEQSSEISALKEANERREALESGAVESLMALPPATVPCADKPLRATINECVRAYAIANGGGAAFSEAWNKVYRELRDRYKVDVKARARNGKRDKLDVVEELGLLPQLHAVILEVFK